jgi:hypothetical protein
VEYCASAGLYPCGTGQLGSLEFEIAAVNKFTVLPTLDGTPTASDVYVRFVPESDGKARALVLETSDKDKVRARDFFPGTDPTVAMCISSAEVSATAGEEVEVRVTDCGLSHGKEFDAVAYITDANGQKDGVYAAVGQPFTVSAGTSILKLQVLAKFMLIARLF